MRHPSRVASFIVLPAPPPPPEALPLFVPLPVPVRVEESAPPEVVIPEALAVDPAPELGPEAQADAIPLLLWLDWSLMPDLRLMSLLLALEVGPPDEPVCGSWPRESSPSEKQLMLNRITEKLHLIKNSEKLCLL